MRDDQMSDDKMIDDKMSLSDSDDLMTVMTQVE
jgi:hypothetical protein